MGLREEIKNANSDAEIASLLKKGQSFDLASDITKRAWKSTARFRLSQLTNQVPAQNPEKPVQSKQSKKPKKNKS